MKFRPLHDRVLLERMEETRKLLVESLSLTPQKKNQ